MSGPVTWSARRPVLVGALGIAILIAVLGFWGGTTKISGAVVTSGTVVVESFRQVVQHQDGGIVAELNVKEGATVEAGDVLIQLDATVVRSEKAIVEGQLHEFLARRARLVAERDEQAKLRFDASLVALSDNNPDIRDLLDGQQRLFEARRATLAEETAQLHEKIAQFRNQIDGFDAQLGSVSRQIDLVEKERAEQQSLLDKGLTQTSRVTTLEREKARLEGRVGELEAGKAQASGQIAETRIEILKLNAGRREEAIGTLRDLQIRVTEMRERQLALQDRLSRLAIRAPMTGIVYGLQIHTLNAVVRPADPILYVVPKDSKLVVQIRVPAIHVDQVVVGQPASLHFSAFDQRTTPTLVARVSKVSPDAFTDEATGATFYQAEVDPLAGEIEKLDHLEIIPGMPVEAFIETEERTPLTFLAKPFLDYLNRAMRES